MMLTLVCSQLPSSGCSSPNFISSHPTCCRRQRFCVSFDSRESPGLKYTRSSPLASIYLMELHVFMPEQWCLLQLPFRRGRVVRICGHPGSSSQANHSPLIHLQSPGILERGPAMERGGPQSSWCYSVALTNFTGFCPSKSGGPHPYSEEG